MQIFYIEFATLTVKSQSRKCEQRKCLRLGRCEGWKEHTYNHNRFKTKEEAETALSKIIAILKQRDHETTPLPDFNASYGLLADVQSLSTSTLQELWDNLTPDNVKEFMDIIGTELESRQ